MDNIENISGILRTIEGVGFPIVLSLFLLKFYKDQMLKFTDVLNFLTNEVKTIALSLKDNSSALTMLTKEIMNSERDKNNE